MKFVTTCLFFLWTFILTAHAEVVLSDSRISGASSTTGAVASIDANIFVPVEGSVSGGPILLKYDGEKRIAEIPLLVPEDTLILGRQMFNIENNFFLSRVNSAGKSSIVNFNKEGRLQNEILIPDLEEIWVLAKGKSIWIGGKGKDNLPRLVEIDTRGKIRRQMAFPSFENASIKKLEFCNNKMIVVAESRAPGHHSVLWTLSETLAVETERKIDVPGVETAVFSDQIAIAYFYGKRAFVESFDCALKPRWKKGIFTKLAGGVQPTLIGDVDRLFYVGANQSKLLVTEFNKAGSEFELVYDTSGMKESIRPYGVEIKGDKLHIFGTNIDKNNKYSNDYFIYQRR